MVEEKRILERETLDHSDDEEENIKYKGKTNLKGILVHKRHHPKKTEKY